MSIDVSPTGEELMGISRDHGLLCQPMFVLTSTASTTGLKPILEILPAHLEYWARMEREQIMFAAGPKMPVDPTQAWSGEGMVIFRAPSMDAAKEIAEADPMHKSQARSYTLSPWLLNHLAVVGRTSEKR
jgi:uncharacterized protein